MVLIRINFKHSSDPLCVYIYIYIYAYIHVHIRIGIDMHYVRIRVLYNLHIQTCRLCVLHVFIQMHLLICMLLFWKPSLNSVYTV